MSKRDYYEVLGLSREATEADIKKAYRRLAMKHHPDRNPDNPDSESFKEAKEAYEVLSEPDKRASYDRFGHAGVNNQPGMGGGFGGGDAFNDIFGDVFGDIFGGGRRGGRSQVFRGADLRYELELSLEQAVAGDSVNLELPTQAECARCAGKGAEPGTSPVTCKTCGGAGQVRVAQGFFSIQQACPSCGGAGSSIDKPCRECSGRGRVRKVKTLAVKVPAETQSGSVFRLRGKGVRSVRASGLGDLFCRVQVETPVNLSSDQKDKLRAFDDSIQNEESRHNPRARSWFDGVKQFFERMGA